MTVADVRARVDLLKRQWPAPWSVESECVARLSAEVLHAIAVDPTRNDADALAAEVQRLFVDERPPIDTMSHLELRAKLREAVTFLRVHGWSSANGTPIYTVHDFVNSLEKR